MTPGETFNCTLWFLLIAALLLDAYKNVRRWRTMSYTDLAKRYPRMKRILLRNWQRNRLK